MTATDWEAPEPAENWVDPDEYVDEEVIDGFDEDWWKAERDDAL